MGNFDLREYWENRYKNRQGIAGDGSGAGSEGVEAITKAQIINNWIKEFEIKTINEIGCGSGDNLLYYKVPISYTGYDISPKAIELCNEKTRKIPNNLKYYFTNTIRDMDFDADLCLLLDVWYHITDDFEFQMLCDTLFVNNNWKYIIIYSTDTDSEFIHTGERQAQHLKQREVLSKVKEFPQWEVQYVLTGFQTSDGKVFAFPCNKKFFLLKNNLHKSL